MKIYNSNIKIPRRKLRKIKLLKIGNKIDDDKIFYKGKKFVNLSGNDYLGLSKNKLSISESKRILTLYGSSSSSSRLISGNYELLEDLENFLSKKLNKQKTLIMGNGFLINSTVIPTITGNIVGKRKKVVIFSDKLNHSSINFGNYFTRQKVHRFKHLDLNHLELLMKKAEKNIEKLIVSESLFSMDGDFCNINELRFLANKYHAILYVDEAHSFGIYGEDGYGISSNGKKSEREITIGTFSKAAGSYGAFISCSKEYYDLLIDHCPGLIYSTALPPSIVASIYSSVKNFHRFKIKREKLKNNSHFFLKNLKKLDINTGNSQSQIIPIILKDFNSCEKLRKKLERNNFFIKSIRTPTVPIKQERLRISLTSNITKQTLKNLIRLLKN